jgi:hypothetical protein
VSQQQLAEKHHVGHTAIHRVCAGKTWPHLLPTNE